MNTSMDRQIEPFTHPDGVTDPAYRNRASRAACPTSPGAWATILFCLLLPSLLQGADPSPADAKKLTEVLGDAAKWKLSTDPVFGGGSGETSITGSGAQMNIESIGAIAAPFECALALRLKPPQGGSTFLTVQMVGAPQPKKSPQTIAFSISAAAAQNLVNYSTTVEGPKPWPSVSGVLYFDAVSERSLAWSDEMRRTIEAGIAAAPRVGKTLIPLRFTVERNRFRAWLNGRFVSEAPLDAGTNPCEVMRIMVGSNVEVASVRVRPLVLAPGNFEPLSVDGNLNAHPPDGYTLVPPPASKLSDARSLVSVDGVPFQLPTLSAGCEDHVDVGRSWTRFGALAGNVDANSGTFGGRWVAADRMDPSRIAMYIPKGQYKTLHLLAFSDDRKDSVPVVTAQFYRPDAGHPFNFTGTVPSGRGDGAKADGVKIPFLLPNMSVHHVVIPLDPDAFSWFTDQKRIGMEITKRVQFYRAYPDPTQYSWHGAGLPSSAQIYAMTLQRAGVEVELEPEHFGHIWTAPATPRYTIALRNFTGAATTAKLVFTTRGDDGKETPAQEKEVALPADGSTVKVPITLKPARYGLNDLSLTVNAGTDSATYHRNLAWLHEDTRERGNWESGRGSIFGFWDWNGGHDTPESVLELPVMAALGGETSTMNYSKSFPDEKSHSTPEIQAIAKKNHFISEAAFTHTIMYITGFNEIPGVPLFDPAKPEESAANMIKAIKKYQYEPGPLSRPTYLPFFTEPNLYPITVGTWPTWWGDPDYQLTEAERGVYEKMLARYLAGARAVRKEWPNLKLLMPYGEPMNTAVFMRLNTEIRDLIDGCALDMPGFERLPEQQINQVVFHRMYPTMKDIRKYKPDPYLVMTEGFCVSSKDIDTGPQGQADIVTRDYLLLMGYGVARFESSLQPFECANYWGEQHYGGGMGTRLPLAMPQAATVHFATLTRHLNRANFVKYVPTGSTSTYCEQFKHYKTGKLVHALWTIRGTRPVNIKVAPGTALELYDANDNLTRLKEKDGVITFGIGQSPCYIEGLKADPVITLGESDHSDARPAGEIAKLSNLGDGSWKIVEKVDEDYTKNRPLQIERFPGKMNASVAEAPAAQGGKALAIHLEKQEKDRGVMPYFTTLEPKRPITIDGKAGHLGLWVRAASDWGRVVYTLRDAKGEKWLSVGTKEEFNNDDIHCWSAFCFDGWRYLKFELPSSAPYDSYREYGTTWWGSYGGDRIVDLPVKLERITVERRPKVIYGNDLVEARPDDVLLGDLNAEYASAADKGDEAVRLSKLRMPVPKGMPELGNPIADLAKTGTGKPTRVLKVMDPIHQYDGTRCHVHFVTVEGAKSYDVWVSPYADGRGALQLASGWTESGKLVEGLHPDTEFYLFVFYTDKDGKLSKPSQPLRFTLKDRFGYK